MFQVKTNDGRDWDVTFKYIGYKNSTQCLITLIEDIENELYFQAHAECSLFDKFVKNTGRKIALARALTVGGFNREDKKLFWNAYFTKRGKW